MILSAVSSSPELLSIDKTVSSTAASTQSIETSMSEQILTSTTSLPEETLADQVEISLAARRRAEIVQYAEYEMYAQSILAENQKTSEMLAQKEQEQTQNQITSSSVGINLVV